MNVSLSRRSLLISSLFAALPITAHARQTEHSTPDASSELLIKDLVTLEGTEQVITMHAIIPDYADPPDTAIYFLDGWGLTFKTPEQAATCHTLMSAAYEEWFTLKYGLTVSDISEIPAADLPDTAEGWIATLSNADRLEDPPQQVAIVTVIRDTTVQLLLGIAQTGSPITELTGHVETTSSRWPDDREPERQPDGSSIGGLWETLPKLDDFPDHIIVKFYRDVSYAF